MLGIPSWDQRWPLTKTRWSLIKNKVGPHKNKMGWPKPRWALTKEGGPIQKKKLGPYKKKVVPHKNQVGPCKKKKVGRHKNKVILRKKQGRSLQKQGGPSQNMVAPHKNILTGLWKTGLLYIELDVTWSGISLWSVWNVPGALWVFLGFWGVLGVFCGFSVSGGFFVGFFFPWEMLKTKCHEWNPRISQVVRDIHPVQLLALLRTLQQSHPDHYPDIPGAQEFKI